METTEELNALLASIEEEVSSEIPVYLHLPAVTYDGDIVLEIMCGEFMAAQTEMT